MAGEAKKPYKRGGVRGSSPGSWPGGLSSRLSLSNINN
jgi:hypothetical protein